MSCRRSGRPEQRRCGHDPRHAAGDIHVLHVLISLVGIAAGLIVLGRFVRNHTLGVSNTVFLVTTILTSVTGFLFPFKAFGPPHIIGAISLVVLAIALFAFYAGKLAGPWRWI